MLARLIAVPVVSLLLALAPIASHAAEAELFPFVVSYDCPENVTNVARWLPAPAGKQGFVRAEAGRLATDAGPVRFWATNICFEGCFPTHEDAERVAARLARLGINCVRMHHMDNYSIWGDSPNKLTIDPKKLELLDYLIYQLKQHGVYTNLNLHVSRWFDVAEGFPAREQRPDYDKGLDNFEPRMIELQKKYARDLLTHVNPYTKTAYTQEPAIAFVEINNENAIYANWAGGDLDKLPEPYAGTYRRLWNAWLRKKYGTTEKLRQAWNARAVPLGSELVRNGDFNQALKEPWQLERDEQTGVEWSIQSAGPEGKRFLRVAVTRQGKVAWVPQLTLVGFAVKKETPYTLSFRARSDRKQRVAVNCMMAHDPWEQLGLEANLDFAPKWQTYRLTFLASADDSNARLSFSNLKPGTYELAEVSLRPGGVTGLEPGQRLEEESVPVVRHASSSMTKAGRRDFCDFLWDAEADYWWGMYRFLKNELGLKSIVAGTQIGYSPAHIQAGLDYLDAHSYWQHPSFPNRPWDPRDWYVNNLALVNTPGGTLSRLAATRIAGLPFTVSEYNHSQPIQYAAEGFLMIAAFGAHQGWDGIYSFAYSHNDRLDSNKLDGFFDIKSDPGRLVHMPACAALFLRGDATRAKQTLTVPVTREDERRSLHESQSAWNITTGRFGLDPKLSLLHAIGMDLGRGTSGSKGAAVPKLEEKQTAFVSDTGELRWDASMPKAGYFTANTPRTRLFTGFVRGRAFQLGDVRLSIGPTRLDWATVSMTAIDGEGFDKPGRLLIAATGLVQNKDWELEDLGNDRVTVRNRWGTEPVLCEGIPADVLLPVAADRVTVYALDQAGNRRGALKPSAQDGKALVRLGPEHKTLWYEVEIR